MRGSFCATLTLSLSLKGQGSLHLALQVPLPLRLRESLDRGLLPFSFFDDLAETDCQHYDLTNAYLAYAPEERPNYLQDSVGDADYSAFGPIDVEPMSKMGKLTAANMQRSWLNVPHVTQFDDADITNLETFRAEMKPEGEKRGVKLTPLPFMLKACAVALRDNPKFRSSLSGDGQGVVRKQYIHIGMAVDTPAGLLVPVIRDVDKKTLWELAEEVVELAGKARDRKLKPAEMQGGCFTISSLGSIGGTGFTPIVNAPEVGILGVSKAAIQPVWDGKEFQPRKMLPLALSYDHRVINGGDAGRFFTQLVGLLSDIRRFSL